MVDLKLVSYIKLNLSKGYTKEELKLILKENGWKTLEIEEAFQQIEKPKQQKPSTFKPKQPGEVPSELVTFVRRAFERGISEGKLNSALASKGWSPDVIAKAISLGKPKQQLKPQPKIIQKEPEKQVEDKKEPLQEKIKKPQPTLYSSRNKGKTILYYILAGLGIFLIFTLTIGLYYNVVGLTSYTITDPLGVQYVGRCLTADCSAMKDFAWNYVTNNVWWITGASLIATLAGLLLFAFLPRHRSIVVWIFNILYLLFLVFIGYVWFSFRLSIQ